MIMFLSNCFLIWIKPLSVSNVSCGKHTAGSCSECPQGHGEIWCNGDCRWDSSRCIPRGTHSSKALVFDFNVNNYKHFEDSNKLKFSKF